MPTMARLGRRHCFPPIIKPAAILPVVAGTIAFTNSGPTAITLTQTVAPSFGTGVITLLWKRGTDGVTFGTSLGATSVEADSTAVAGTLYYYRIDYTDGASQTASSNVVSAQIYTGGALTGGGANRSILPAGLSAMG